MTDANDPLQGFKWNEHPDAGSLGFHDFMVLLITLDEGRPTPIGSGFVISTYDDHAVCITAAHNFWEGVRRAQNPHPIASSSMPDFLRLDNIALERKKIRAIYQNGDQIEVCILGFAVWDKSTDLAIFTIARQSPGPRLFDCFAKLVEVVPAKGDLIGVLGYSELSVENVPSSDGVRSKMTRRLLLRVGTVTAVHNDGHSLTRGPCVETSIPIYGGMSGGPAFLLPPPGGEIVPFGVLTSDPDDPADLKLDRSRSGSSIVSQLMLRVTGDDGTRRNVSLKMSNIGLAENSEIPSAEPGQATSVQWCPTEPL
jgi:hypothetical protein